MSELRNFKAALARGERDGAALVTAIFVIAVLLAIAITFWRLAGQEARTARNVANNVRATLLAESGASIAIAALNADLVASRAITSIDAIARQYYGPEWQYVYDRLFAGQENSIPPYLWLPVYSKMADMDGIDNNDDGWVDEPGEMKDIIGRYVFVIVDEAGKINLNAADNPGVDLWELFGSDNYRYAHLSNEGVTAAEIDLGVPWPVNPALSLRSGPIGRAHRFAYFRYGAPEGDPVLGERPPQTDPAIDDSAFPGRANWDDDADNLFVSSNGVDDNGNGLIDEYWGDGVDNDGDGLIDEADELPVEGVDEPDEFRPFNPVSASVYATDGVDNDGDSLVDEPGELGE
jgi:hypothetical protein